MKALLLLLWLISTTHLGAEWIPFPEPDWQVLPQAGIGSSGTELKLQKDGDWIHILHTGSRPVTLPLFILEAPGIQKPVHVVRGSLRHRGVEGRGYLEMWTCFSQDRCYFTRGLADAGPMASLQGDSEIRDYELPFQNSGKEEAVRLIINLVLDGPGEVWIAAHPTLWQADQYGPMTAGKLVWWSPHQGNQVFGWLGALLGCLGGICGWLNQKEKARQWVLRIYLGLTMTGILGVMSGLFAWSQGQPGHVHHPLLLMGALLTLMGPLLTRQVRIRERALELRRMEAMDSMA